MFIRIPRQLIIKLRAHLKKGGVIAYATESCFGLGVLPCHHQALRYLIQLKKREKHKGLIVIGDDLKRFYPMINPLPQATRDWLNNVWPAAQSFLIEARPIVSPLLRGRGRKKIALRVPDHTQARWLCRCLNSPLVSTSANMAHQYAYRHWRTIKLRLPSSVLVVPGRIGKHQSPSQIIDLLTFERLR